MNPEKPIEVACRTCPLGRHRRILVAIDGSKYSKRALKQAISIARLCGSNLIVLRVIRVRPGLVALAPQLMKKMKEEFLETAKAEAAKENVACETIIHQGEPLYEFIIATAKEKGADVIVMGTHGRAGLERLLMSGVTAKVIGHASCPVLVVPLKVPVTLKRIVAATDGSKFSEAAVKEAIGIAKACRSSLTVVCVVKPDRLVDHKEEARKIVEEVRKNASGANVETQAIVPEGEPYETIIQVAKEKNAGVIIMGSYGRTGLKRLLMGSVTEKVISHAPCSVLVVSA